MFCHWRYPPLPECAHRRSEWKVALGPGCRRTGRPNRLCWNQMRIDPNGAIGGSPLLAVRKMLRYLRGWDQWKVADLEAVAALAPRTGDALVKALRTEGLIEASGK